MVKARKSRERLLESSVRINSVVLQLEHAAAQMRVAQTIKTSTTLLKGMQSMMSIPQLQQVCVSMSKEMVKAGMIEEAVSDLMDADADVEQEAETEVNKVLDEVFGEILGRAGEAKRQIAAAAGPQKDDEKEAAVDAEEEELARKMASLDVVK